MVDYRTFVAEDCRRLILQALAREASASLNSVLIDAVLTAHGHNKPSAYIAEQLDWLAARDAVSLTEAGGILIAKLLNKGLEHVERRALIPGVGKPGLEA